MFAGVAKIRRAELIEVLADSSSRALPIVAIVNVLMGAILAFVGAVQLKAFGAGIYVADLVGIASVRELTPIITAIVLAGRTGASFAARIATMQGNEEIDALTTLGVSPVEFLVLPRVLALCLLMPLALRLRAARSRCSAGCSLPCRSWTYRQRLIWRRRSRRSPARISRSAFSRRSCSAALVALVGCHYGLRAPRSAAGVGSATTSAVVVSIIGVIALDAVFAVCANALGV